MLNSVRSVLQFRKFEFNGELRRLRKAANIQDLRSICKRRLPVGVFGYIDGAAEDERTLQKNIAAYSEVAFKPRVLRDVDNIDLSTNVLGVSVPFPLIISPTGFTRIAHPLGEIAVARAAAREQVPFTLSTMATRSIEEIAALSACTQQNTEDQIPVSARNWFQIYVWKDRGLLRELLHRVKQAGFEAIMITVDTAVLGRRERDVRRGFTLPPKIGIDTFFDGIKHPAWTWGLLSNDPIRFANVVGSGIEDGSTAITLADHVNAQFDPSLSWGDIEWFRNEWDGPIVLKGIQTVEDAKIATTHGLDAIALSNHGGRQLDDAPAPLKLVEPVTQSVGGQIEVYCDGGVRRGSDIVKAIALGATACMAGRPTLYGLGAAGERGVDWVLHFLREGMERTMALLGVRDLSNLGKDHIDWS